MNLGGKKMTNPFSQPIERESTGPFDRILRELFELDISTEKLPQIFELRPLKTEKSDNSSFQSLHKNDDQSSDTQRKSYRSLKKHP